MVFEKIQGKEGHRWYLWVFRSETTVSFRLDPSRSATVPKEHFGEEATGILNVDRYSAYKTLLADGRIVLAFCLAHVRRDFLDVAKSWPELEDWAFLWVGRIGELFALNKQRVAVQADAMAFAGAERALVAAVDATKTERDAQLADPALHPACRKPLDSLVAHWSGLVVFVAHPEVPMDNSQAERDLRNPVCGRKSYRGSMAVWSGQLMVMVMSLVQTLLAWNLDPRLWLSYYFERCAELGGVAPDNAERWLPWNLDDDERSEFQLLTPRPVEPS
jgi:transposase